MKSPIQLLLILILTFFYQCDSDSEKQTDFHFPELEHIDSNVYNEIKLTCEEYWDLSTMIDTTFEIYPEGLEYAVHCDGYIDSSLYHFVIRVDEYGKWINDGRTKKE